MTTEELDRVATFLTNLHKDLKEKGNHSCIKDFETFTLQDILDFADFWHRVK